MEETVTPQTGVKSWDDVVNQPDTPPQPAGDQENLFLRLKAQPEPYKFRIVGKPVTFRRHWNAFKSLRKEDGKPVGPVISPAYNLSDIKLDAAWEKGGYKPDVKYAALVLNRETNRFCVVEAGPGVFKTIVDYQKETKVDICGDTAPDWLVRVKKVRGPKGEKTEYSVVALPPTTLTEEEKNRLANFNSKGDWRRFFKTATPEQIAELYGKLDESLKKNPQAQTWKKDGPSSAASSAPSAPSTPAPAKTAEKAPAVASNPDDESWAKGDAAVGDSAQF